jgi:mannose-1-phosphate guanylyltransferase
MIVPVILSGGSGTRLWPLSTPQRPKQFLKLVGERSLFQVTLERVADRLRYYPPVVVSNAAHKNLCLEELAAYGGARLILEPCARNTAAAIVMAAKTVADAYGPEQIMLVMPSDHLIGDLDSFHRAVELGKAAAESGHLLTFGIAPTGPETGFGYLEAGDALADAPGTFGVETFTEKPELAKAEQMVATGRHFWNGGIFMFRAGDLLEEAGRLAPEIHGSAVQAIDHAERHDVCIVPSLAELEPCPNISVDYAVMERSDRVAMVPLDADWSDVGSWDALANIAVPASGALAATSINSSNCFVRTDGIKVALLGVDNLIVVATADQVLVMQKGHSQDIRQLVSNIAAEE